MIDTAGDCQRVTVPMVFGNAQTLMEEGATRLGDGVTLFDLGAVSESDSSALAVIFAWARRAAARGGSVRIANTPASLLSLADLYGVSEFLPLA
ncbi:STAS domain-containing protein [Rhodocyclus tenuis]|uniref:STAS domain-containing protein n=2 Tax=Rhodocyclus TaxID=1064 RepID=A0A6L5JZ42_RHOTE|nr:STAS domain-containing protein [Rhodocyclus gracilis]MQY52615.1 STAS domain-containing protein [Rhodocyclus gracilis]NJA88951.1 STAS domain-containing protein [Rhodocyclus gracilis]